MNSTRSTLTVSRCACAKLMEARLDKDAREKALLDSKVCQQSAVLSTHLRARLTPPLHLVVPPLTLTCFRMYYECPRTSLFLAAQKQCLALCLPVQIQRTVIRVGPPFRIQKFRRIRSRQHRTVSTAAWGVVGDKRHVHVGHKHIDKFRCGATSMFGTVG